MSEDSGGRLVVPLGASAGGQKAYLKHGSRSPEARPLARRALLSNAFDDHAYPRHIS